MRQKKKKKTKWIAAVILVAAVFAVWYFGTFSLSVTHAQIKSDKVKNEVKIVQLSDLHGASFGRNNADLINTIEKQAPDMIFITGDMYTSADETGKQTAIHLMSALAKKFPVYFVSGEHDDNPQYLKALEDGGVQVLDYRSAQQTVGGTKIMVYGISNVYYSGTFDLANELEPLSEDSYNILLAHIPNFDAFARFGFDAAFCGDSHGGQVRLPFIGPVNYEGAWLPVVTYPGDMYDKGLYHKDGMDMFVSTGLGNFPVPVRFLNMPEVAVVTITP